MRRCGKQEHEEGVKKERGKKRKRKKTRYEVVRYARGCACVGAFGRVDVGAS